MNNKLTSNFYYGVLILFFLAVLLQMSNVFFFHDDYGYMTLSYAGINIPQANGTSYGPWELLQFLFQHYMTWGGRVLYFFIEIVLGSRNIWILRIVESVIITLIIALMIRDSNKNIYSAIVILMAYFSLPLTVTADGLYWYSASVLYLFPLLPFFAGCILFYKFCFKRELTQGEKSIMYIALFAATFSQEQISSATVFFVTACLFLTAITSRKYSYGAKKEYIAAAAVSYLGFLVLMASPGNWSRAVFDDMTLMQRMINNGSLLVLHQYLESGKIYQSILLVINILMGLHLYRNRAAGLLFTSVSVMFSIFLLLLNIRYLSGCWNGLMRITGYSIPLTCSILLLHFSTVIGTVFLYCKNVKGSMEKFLFLLAGLVALLFMLVAPSAVPYRSALPFYFIMIFILGDMAKELCSSTRLKGVNAVWLCVLSVLAAANYAGIVEGYAANSIVHRTNDIILKNASDTIKNGSEIGEVILYKALDDSYGSTPAYDKEYIQDWIKKYYRLPENTVLEYVDYI
jgi:hypothetical protein